MGGPMNINFGSNDNQAVLKYDTLRSKEETIYFNGELLARGIILGNDFINSDKKVLSFSETKQKLDLNFILPTDGINWGKLHPKNAVDIAASCGTPVYAAESGLVINLAKNGWNSGYGKYIELEHLSGIKTLYAHLSLINIKLGDYINRGGKIGEVGDSGESTGCHLHFEIKGLKNPFVK